MFDFVGFVRNCRFEIKIMPPGENELFNFEIRDPDTGYYESGTVINIEIRDPDTGYYESGTVNENDENCGYNLNEYIKSMLEMLVARIESRKAHEHAARDSSQKRRDIENFFRGK